MKKVFLSMFVALMATVVAQAQQIAVVSGSTTSTYKTLADAITEAPAGSVIYLPGGGFPLSDDVKITKKLTIIGIGYNAESDNADGRTLIEGNLFFNAGSDDSAVMGCYINGNVYIGDGSDQPEVDNILIKFCNLNSVQVQNSSCLGTVVNQNLIRDVSNFHYAGGKITNNILRALNRLKNVDISNNVITSDYANTFYNCDDCTILNNVILSWGGHWGSNCQISGNLLNSDWGSPDNINMNNVDWNDVFENNAGVNPVSNYHFKEAYNQYEGKRGIYGGTGFSDGQLPPIPYISYKSVPTETDASGNLHVNITVNAK